MAFCLLLPPAVHGFSTTFTCRTSHIYGLTTRGRICLTNATCLRKTPHKVVREGIIRHLLATSRTNGEFTLDCNLRIGMEKVR
ncbi:hypothetical protein FA15DRAFT_406076 [Coprinopsis marcescibilis]|uniref:Uncharacterized protein n=1 Tax=Coprinopsis marcescibilis TaxID=230819 RepID=A0A5C3KWJ4_COPMA|nr:hypothetical protein FA15DRAFT_406076 [Coprinopsis marcescibilis]